MKLYINDLILHNKKLYGINIGDSVDEVFKNKSLDFTLHGDSRYGYYYLSNGYRFGFAENIVDEIGIDFNHTDSIISIKSVNERDFDLNKKKIHEVLNALNDLQVRWQATPDCDINYLTIQLVDADVLFIFDIYEGTLSKITKSNLILK